MRRIAAADWRARFAGMRLARGSPVASLGFRDLINTTRRHSLIAVALVAASAAPLLGMVAKWGLPYFELGLKLTLPATLGLCVGLMALAIALLWKRRTGVYTGAQISLLLFGSAMCWTTEIVLYLALTGCC